jgi:hypothetical protein
MRNNDRIVGYFPTALGRATRTIAYKWGLVDFNL